MPNSLDNFDLSVVVKQGMKKAGLEAGPKDVISESYVATPKSYGQVTEFLSQKTKDAHIQLYHDYVDQTNRISAELDTADRSGSNSKHSDYRSLKLDETYNTNGMFLHELFFSNCFDPHSEIFMDSLAYIRIQRDFGTFDDWQRDFIACAGAAGEGWAVCGYNMLLKRFVNTIVSNQSQDMMIGLYPIIVLDVWAHAYYRDYLTDKKSYIVAMLRQLNWNIIEDRVKRADAIAQAVK